jgi:hypothetical protein
MDEVQNVSTVGSFGLNFQKIVLIILIIILIVSLVFIGMQITQTNKTQPWPPIVPQCPDYWKMGSSGRCVPTSNAPGSNSTGCKNSTDFTIGDYAGAGGACAKKKWADSCNVAWEGVTYGTTDKC